MGECNQMSCPNSATNVVHWPDGPKTLCDRHTSVAVQVAGAMGFRVSVEPMRGDVIALRADLSAARARVAVLEAALTAAVAALEWADANVRALTGGDERRIRAAVASGRVALNPQVARFSTTAGADGKGET